MSQTVPLTVKLGPARTGLAIGYRILNLDGTTYSAFTTASVSESPSGSGTYSAANGVSAPDAGGYVVVGVSGTDYDRGVIDPAPALASNWTATRAGHVDTINTNAAAILADTGTDGVVVASGSKAGYSLSADQSGVTVGTVNALGATAQAQVNAEVDQALVDVGLSATVTERIDTTISSRSTLTAQQVWEYATRTLSSFGTLLADIWAYTTRTLTSTAAETVAAVSGSTLNITRSATFTATLTGLTIPATWSKIYFTIKTQNGLSDTEALVHLLKSNPGGDGDGLVRLNGASTISANGSLTINQGAGTVQIVIADDATANLNLAAGLFYDVKALLADGTSTVLTQGTCKVALTATEAIT